MNGIIALNILFVSIFLFWTLYNLPAFLVGLKRYTKIRKHARRRMHAYFMEASFNVKWGRCPRCGVHDILVEVPGLKAFCRKCLRKAIRILEEASKKALSREDVERIKVVEDWNPPEGLTSYEDYSLTQHVLRKGYKWVTTPVLAFHFKDWRKLAKNRLCVAEAFALILTR